MGSLIDQAVTLVKPPRLRPRRRSSPADEAMRAKVSPCVSLELYACGHCVCVLKRKFAERICRFLLGFDEGRRDNTYPFAPTTLVRGLGGIAVVYAKGTQKTRCMEYF